jgi:hypothetical protein
MSLWYRHRSWSTRWRSFDGDGSFQWPYPSTGLNDSIRIDITGTFGKQRRRSFWSNVIVQFITVSGTPKQGRCDFIAEALLAATTGRVNEHDEKDTQDEEHDNAQSHAEHIFPAMRVHVKAFARIVCLVGDTGNGTTFWEFTVRSQESFFAVASRVSVETYAEYFALESTTAPRSTAYTRISPNHAAPHVPTDSTFCCCCCCTYGSLSLTAALHRPPLTQ